jgi:lipopolysaccharide transport system ATP-binding protein
LLEVGTGFHPELTGRENIFLNGAILGMTRAEIRRKFDEIVAFSEVEKVLDTPVKRYSSGMYVRLAFSVAAHLESEILIVDEVLAVGDAAFQEKCLGKMRGFAETKGRTVLFVSHNMSSIRQLCQRVCLLEKGQLALVGTPDEAIGRYLSDAVRARRMSLTGWTDRLGTGEARIDSIELQPDEVDDRALVKMNDTFRIRIEATLSEPLVDPTFGVLIHDTTGTSLLDLRTIHQPLRLGRVEGKVTVQLEVKSLGLYPGQYLISPFIGDAANSRDIDFVRTCSAFDVMPSATETNLHLDRDWGCYFVPSAWTVPDSSAK